MGNKEEESRIDEEIYRKAEERLAGKQVEDVGRLSAEEARALVHKLQVYQVELELQNVELRKSREELEARVEARTKELAEREGVLRAIFDSTVVSLVIADDDARIVDANRSAEDLVGEPKSRLLGRMVAEFVFQGYDFQQAWAAFKEGNLVVGEIRIVRPDGSVRCAEFHGQPDVTSGRHLFALVDTTERRNADKQIRQIEAQKREFYQRTILAVTNGKLVIAEPAEIDRLAGTSTAEWTIAKSRDLAIVRQQIVTAAHSAGMEEQDIHRFMTCVGESINNAYKHAGGGKASLHRTENGLLLKVRDSGPGIRALYLPDVALTYGYTTAGTLGAGYKLMIASADRVYLATGPQGTTVACEMHLPDKS